MNGFAVKQRQSPAFQFMIAPLKVTTIYWSLGTRPQQCNLLHRHIGPSSSNVSRLVQKSWNSNKRCIYDSRLQSVLLIVKWLYLFLLRSLYRLYLSALPLSLWPAGPRGKHTIREQRNTCVRNKQLQELNCNLLDVRVRCFARAWELLPRSCIQAFCIILQSRFLQGRIRTSPANQISSRTCFLRQEALSQNSSYTQSWPKSDTIRFAWPEHELHSASWYVDGHITPVDDVKAVTTQ